MPHSAFSLVVGALLALGLCAASPTNAQAPMDADAFEARAADLVDQMTLEEKASLASGQAVWTTESIDRLDLPSICL